MRIDFFCSWWGLDHLGYEGMLSKIKSAGFDGVEIGIPYDNKGRNNLLYLLDKYQLKVIAHQYQAFGSTVKEYTAALEKSLINAVEFNPISVNSHTGKDHWCLDDNLKILDICDRIEEKFKIPILHETHRGRFLYSAPVSKIFFDLRKNIKITFDISHWCCVSESLLEDQQDTVDEAVKRTGHIHARVGHTQGPQITDIQNDYWEKEITVFMNWWKKIFELHNKQSKEFLTITPEFGPLPYSPLTPYQKKSYVDFFEQNVLTMNLIKNQIK